MKFKLLCASSVLSLAMLSSYAQAQAVGKSTFKDVAKGIAITLETSDSINSKYVATLKDGSVRSGSLVLNVEKVMNNMREGSPVVSVLEEKLAEGSSCPALEFSFSLQADPTDVGLSIANLNSADSSAGNCLDIRSSDYYLQK